MKNGDMETRLEVATDADIYPAAQNLNSIQEGLGIAVTEKMKSERMKIDLITNVSHDLKTPLTSIISYVELLHKEAGLPEHVNDYIKILAQKSERLKNLIQDLFDLSKASSENIALDMEQLDLARLIKQTLADMEEPINASGLTFRLNIPDEPVYIVSDGKKLYRVWENLIANTLKYSLLGSRVFIDLTVDQNGPFVTIKNTANYEMNFTEDEILQRFVRGDESRTTEGAGLGLSIAQSFTQICGGQFSIKIDGDLFKVALRFCP
jgi:signal transduction histidine kinase